MLLNTKNQDVTNEFDTILHSLHPKKREAFRHEFLPGVKEVLEPSKPHGKMFRLETRARYVV